MFTKHLFKMKLHTRRVLITRRALPIMAFLIASVMMVWPTLVPQREQFSVASESNKKRQGAKIDMEQVRYYANNQKNQPLTVVSPKVFETDPDKMVATLYKPVATYLMDKGDVLTSKTPSGLYYEETDQLFFEDTVVTTTDSGYKSNASHVVCDNPKGLISSEYQITITGPTGKLKADGFQFYNKGNNIDFTKKTDTTIYSQEGDLRIRSTNGLNIDQIPQTITAIENVIAEQEGKILTADKMILHYYTKKQNPDNRIRQIEAFGHVVAKEVGGQTIEGDYGIYDPVTAQIRMDGEVVLRQGDSYMDGEGATMDLNTGKSVLIPKGTAEGKPERIRGRLLPEDFKGDEK